MPSFLALFAALTVASALCLLPARTGPFEGARAGEEREISKVKFCWAPAGTFRMGSASGEPDRRVDEGPVTVTLSRGFWIGKYELTQGQWTARMGPFPREPDKGVGDEFPVYWVNYPEAEEFCRRLTAQSRASGALPNDWEIRLPTEAQWEYACRAGSPTATSFGATLTFTQANIGSQCPGDGPGNPAGKASKVGSYPANAWGLYDMHGNVWEWCRDWYHRQLPGGRDPDLSAEKGEMNRDGTYSRVRRGGAWIEQGWACRSAMRLRYEPERRSDHIGFRVVAVRL
jgi:formylglycine-generating enzyme required for sulfatase activity